MVEICPYLFCAHVFYSNWILFINSISAFIWCHSASQEVETSPPKLVRMAAFQFFFGLSDTQNYFKTGPSKCRELELHGYLSMVKNDLSYWCPTLQFELQFVYKLQTWTFWNGQHLLLDGFANESYPCSWLHSGCKFLQRFSIHLPQSEETPFFCILLIHSRTTCEVEPPTSPPWSLEPTYPTWKKGFGRGYVSYQEGNRSTNQFSQHLHCQACRVTMIIQSLSLSMKASWNFTFCQTSPLSAG